ncbi:hypothetical protein GY45DRAFT_1340712 [Cubamyces sp. BRFM 1775]|nr:hypothetical protein GY45DRAFT_1340712 [Cubamyces sp. BRFM 1775]
MSTKRRGRTPDEDSESSESDDGNATIFLTENSSETFGFRMKTAEPRYQRLGQEAAYISVGPMPVGEFLNEFLRRQQIMSETKEKMPSPDNAFAGLSGCEGKAEAAFYEPLTRALNADGVTKRPSRCPGFVFRITGFHPDTSGGQVGSCKPDITCYAEQHTSTIDVSIEEPLKARSDMGLAVTFIEVKSSRSDDHYADPPEDADLEDWSFALGKVLGKGTGGEDKALSDFGQNVAYAIAICARQLRIFCFSVSLSGTSARLIRWDRAGAIVTEAFDLLTNPEHLCDFFWCLAHLTDEQRGFDCTARPATEKEEQLFVRSVRAHILRQAPDLSSPNPHVVEDRIRRYLDAHYHCGCVTAVELGSSDNIQDGTLLISRPTSTPLSLTGRCTRGYWAVHVFRDVQKDIADVVFLKDTWRYAGTIGGSVPSGDEGHEGAILRRLRDKGVQNIPAVVCHGDVPGGTDMTDMLRPAVIDVEISDLHATKTQAYAMKKWAARGGELQAKQIVPRIHYRLVLAVAGFDLLQITGTRELLHSMYDAFVALRGAFERAGQLHRDVHPGNIILYRNGSSSTSDVRTGYLIDWDCSREVGIEGTGFDEYEPSSQQIQWQFSSYAIAQRTRVIHSIQDDMESLLYVSIYCGLLRLPFKIGKTRSTHKELRNLITRFFDDNIVTDGKVRGGEAKLRNMTSRTWTKRLRWESKAMKAWLDRVYDILGRSALDVDLNNTEERMAIQTLHAVNEFWQKFLNDNPDIAHGDRRDNILENEHYYNRIAPRIAFGKPAQGTVSVGTKRPRPDSDKRAGSTKRRRTEVPRPPIGPSTGLTIAMDPWSLRLAAERGASSDNP